jgi:radical SAM superfamily enzyme YgiQ (UPF0313 family)
MTGSPKKVALIFLYSEGGKGIPPLAGLYLATALKRSGHAVKIFHKDAKDLEKLIREIDEFKPDLIGQSVFTGYLNKINADLSRTLKGKGYKIMWGNAHPALLPEQALTEPFIDFVILGEGEETLVELAEKLLCPEEYKSIKSLAFKDLSGNIVINERREFMDMDKYLPDWSLIDVKNYLISYFSGQYKRVLAITTSRGCPFNCQFCYNQVFNNRRWRAHSAEKVIANLRPLIEKYKIDGIRFLDDNFFVDKKRALEIVRALGLPYFAETRAENITPDFVRELVETHCEEIMFGFESGSDRIMKEVVQKGTGVKEIINAVTLLRDTKITCSGSFVFGFPGETKEEYRQTMEFIIQLLEINPNLAFTTGWFLPFPGTGLYNVALAKGFKPPERIEDWDKFDRWSNKYKMDWIEWDYETAVKYSRRVVHLLAMAHKRNIPILKGVLKWRIRNLNFSFPVDILFFSKLRNIYMFSGDKNIFTRGIRWIVRKIIKFR